MNGKGSKNFMGTTRVKNIQVKKESYTLSALIPQDAGHLRKFWKLIAEETTHTLRYPEEVLLAEAELKESISHALSDKKTLWLGISRHNEIVGAARFCLPLKNHPWYQHLGTFDMAILKEHWGRGLGKNLLMTLEDFAQSIGILKMEAYVRADNLRAITLYERLGYEIEGRRKKTVKIDNQYKDEYIIGKIL